jgi:hypothetical protein
MNTHDAAKVLSSVANALRVAPNQGLDELAEGGGRKVDTKSVDVPRALSMLVALSYFDKVQWMQVADELRLPVDIRSRDASRDIMWKILRYLERNPEARNRLTHTATRQRSQTSPELAQALEFLLKP